MPNTYCNHIQKGLFVSHQGVGVCCVNTNKFRGVGASEFWNGKTRSTALKRMQNDLEVDGCQGCYKTEQKKMPSTRNFARSYDQIPSKSMPTMLDVDFSNFCNLKCVMCNETRSSEWGKDLGLPVSTVSYKLIDDVISISDHVEHLTVQGGEPSIMPEYEYFFEKLDEKDLISKIDLQVITNITNVNKKFYDLLGKFKSVRLCVSVDAYGPANDYIRWPSKFDAITKNIRAISDLPNSIQIDINNSLNILSMFNYNKFLEWGKNLEDLFESKGKVIRMVPLKVQNPKEYSPFSAPMPLKEKFAEDIKAFMESKVLKHNSNWKLETLLLLRGIQNSPEDPQAITQLKKEVQELDIKRHKRIYDFIPDFYNYL
jgi:hypothetical protein